MPSNETVKAQPIVEPSSTTSSRPPHGQVGTTSAPLHDATKTVGSEPHMWQPAFVTTFQASLAR
jgi:hypothetical protein